MNIRKYIILSVTVVAALTMTACFEEKELSGPVVAPELHLTVLDVDGTAVSGATVDLFANKDDYSRYNNLLASAPTDASGVAIFSQADLGVASFFHYSASVGDDRNWDGSIAKSINVTNGITNLSTSVDAVTLSTAISGDAQIVSGTSGSFWLADYPGKYEWSIISGPDGAISEPTGNSITVAFPTSPTDAAGTIQVIATPDGFPSTTMTFDYTVTKFCEFTPALMVGDWVLDMQDSFGDGWNGASVTFEVDGVGTDYTVAEDLASGQETITVPGGTTSLKFFFNSGDWDEEVTFQITAPNAVEVYADGPTPATGEFEIDTCLL